MSTLCPLSRPLTRFAWLAALFASPAYADPLVSPVFFQPAPAAPAGGDAHHSRVLAGAVIDSSARLDVQMAARRIDEHEIAALRAEKNHEIAALRQELAAQKKTIAAQSEAIEEQKARLASLQALADEFAAMKSQLAAWRRSSSLHRVRPAAGRGDCCSEDKWCRLSDSNR